jgi:hypothetical protein
MSAIIDVLVAAWLTIFAAAPEKPAPKREPIVVSQACLDAPLAPDCMP